MTCYDSVVYRPLAWEPTCCKPASDAASATHSRQWTLPHTLQKRCGRGQTYLLTSTCELFFNQKLLCLPQKQFRRAQSAHQQLQSAVKIASSDHAAAISGQRALTASHSQNHRSCWQAPHSHMQAVSSALCPVAGVAVQTC